jgi:L-ascorbate metabolism protein UlaG (beta-lactamase superfamily)
MEIEFFGANCFRIKTKKASIVVDDNLADIGGKTITKDSDVALFTSKIIENEKTKSRARLILDSAGEYEIGDLSIKGIQTRSHMDEKDAATATVFQCVYENSSLTILGHIHPDIADDVLELAGGTDVVIVPVGGNGYTLDAIGAVSVIKKIEPEVVIPSQYDVPSINLEVPAAPLEDFKKTSALPDGVPKDSYRVGKIDPELVGKTHLVELNVKRS